MNLDSIKTFEDAQNMFNSYYAANIPFIESDIKINDIFFLMIELLYKEGDVYLFTREGIKKYEGEKLYNFCSIIISNKINDDIIKYFDMWLKSRNSKMLDKVVRELMSIGAKCEYTLFG